MTLNWEKYDIDPSKVRGGKSTCPQCSHTRKNKRDLCLSVDLETGLFNCHNCDFKGTAREFKPKKDYSKPEHRLEKLSKKTLEFFENDRKISNNTLLRMKVTEGREWMPQYSQETACICFNYYRGEQLVNIKFRGPGKSFKMVKDAELIFYNIDAIKGEDVAIIVEGEIDCLSLYEAGVYNSVSVPNGASKGNQKLEYLDNCWKDFEPIKKIILAVDNDEAGKSLRTELARRLGKEKCFIVEFPEDCKDSNDVLVKHGIDTLKDVIKNATEMPLEGIVTMDEMFPTIREWYLNGYPKGAKARIPDFDELLSFAPGQLTMWTGVPGHGKDEFSNLIMANLSKHEGWCWGVLGFEESPEESATKLMEKFTGKAFAFRDNAKDRINPEEFEYAIGMVDKHFKFISTDDVESSIEGILEKATEMVKKYGIKGFCLNPWNWLEKYREAHISETEHVSICLTKIVQFAKKYQLHFFLMAHPTKITKGKDGKYEIPTLYSISGSANFFNKTHNGITVYRDYENNNVTIYVQKVKQSWLGKIGSCRFAYSEIVRQYKPLNGSDSFHKIEKEKIKPVELFSSSVDVPEDLPF